MAYIITSLCRDCVDTDCVAVCLVDGHQASSQIMEGMVADGYVGYDAAAGAFHLTGAGEQWLGTSGEGER